MRDDAIAILNDNAGKLDLNFWKEFNWLTENFPDTDTGLQMEINLAQVAITMITSKFALQFKPDVQTEILDNLFTSIKLCVIDNNP